MLEDVKLALKVPGRYIFTEGREESSQLPLNSPR